MNDDHVRRLARVGFDAGMTVHDLSNVVGAVIGYAQLAHMTGDVADYRQAVDVIEPALQRARQSIARFKTDADGSGVLVPTDLGTFAAAVSAVIQNEIERAGHTIIVNIQDSVPVLIRGVDQATVVSGLIVNLAARRHSPSVITVKVTASNGMASLRIDSRPRDAAESSTRPVKLSAAEWDLIRRVVVESDLRLVDADSSGTDFGFHLTWPISAV